MKEGFRLTRRKLLLASAGALASYYILNQYSEDQDDFKVGLLEEGKPFGNPDANRIAQSLGISAGSYFKFDSKVLDRLSAFSDKDLLPIYPPSVHKHKSLIYDLSREFKVAPNIIATIMTVESAGDEKAGSSAGAIGLFQPLDDKFPSSIQNIKDEDLRLDAMRNPKNNGRAGMRYFTEFCLPAAREDLYKLRPNHPSVVAKAMIGYNAGSRSAFYSFDDLPEESKFYGDHAIRFFETAEIAAGLKKLGYDNHGIVQALSSREIDSRAGALLAWVVKRGRYSYDDHSKVLDVLATDRVSNPPRARITRTEMDQIHADYQLFKTTGTPFELPASPGLRIWLSLGGTGLLYKSLENANPENWKNLST